MDAQVDREMMLQIAEIIINELKLEDVTPETFDMDLNLVDELGIDSMGLTTVVLVLQDKYHIRIDEDDFPRRVGRLYDFCLSLDLHVRDPPPSCGAQRYLLRDSMTRGGMSRMKRSRCIEAEASYVGGAVSHRG